MQNNIRILFWLYRSKINDKGLAPIYLRITKLGERVEQASGIFIDPRRWDSRRGRIKGNSEEINELNSSLVSLQSKILRIQSSYQNTSTEFSLQELKQQLNPNNRQKGFVEYFIEHNSRIRTLIGKDYSEGSEELYENTKLQFVDYLINSTGQVDLPLRNLNYGIIEGFSDYLKTERGNTTNTVVKKIQRLNRVVNILLRKGVIQSNPFSEFRIKKEIKDVVYLTEKELKRIQNKRFDIPRLDLVKDLFIFSCYTGLAYNEVNALTLQNISPKENGVQWIKITRRKTGRTQEIPLLKEATDIIKKYEGKGEDRVFPSLSNQKLNSYLKEIGDLCGIAKRLHFHVARKTFSTTVTLTKGVSIETVSKLLGHSNISITSAYYSKVSKEKILKEFMRR